MLFSCINFSSAYLLSSLDPVIDPQHPPEQAGFRHGRSTTNQVTLLTDDIEAGFEHNQKVGIALADLTATYDLKLLRRLPDQHNYGLVCDGTSLTNRSFTLRTSDGQVSRTTGDSHSLENQKFHRQIRMVG